MQHFPDFAAPFYSVVNLSLPTTYTYVQQFRYKEITITQPLFIWLHRKIGNPLFSQKDATIRGLEPSPTPENAFTGDSGWFPRISRKCPQPTRKLSSARWTATRCRDTCPRPTSSPTAS